jgi:hypothetical protein
VQSTLQDQQSILQQKIYTLRIHKYAYKLYNQLIEGDHSSIRQGDIKFIQAISDPDRFDTEEKPDARLQFICESASDFKGESLEKPMEEMISDKKGSGDYYGVEFHPEFVTFDDYLSNLRSTPPELIVDDVHIYQDGDHYWAQSTLSLEVWLAQISDEGWLKYWSKSWPPLISNLKIQIDNPLEDKKEDPSGIQVGLESFE